VVGGDVLNGIWNSQRYPGGGGNLWRVDRAGSGWGVAKRLPDVINRDSSIFSPSVTADGSLYFMRPVGDTGHFHLYRSAFREGKYEEPVAVSFHAPDSVSDVDAAVAADESFIVFSSRRAPAKKMELFIVLRKNGVWGSAQQLGEGVNRGLYSIEARLGPAGKRLYFSSAYVPEPLKVAAASGGMSSPRRAELERSEWATGLTNIWSVSLEPWVR